jgi:hypothetical protein
MRVVVTAFPPKANHAGAKCPVFRDHRPQLKPGADPAGAVLLRCPVYAAACHALVSVAFGLVGLLNGGLVRLHLRGGGAEDTFGVVTQRGRIVRWIVEGGGPDAARKVFPFNENWFDVCEYEFTEPHEVFFHPYVCRLFRNLR